ncbi:MAG: hypothetical protein M3237_18860 [Actinomycetota bacterium]|nr:hypothetical protein [Actinomycetota bacterium]
MARRGWLYAALAGAVVVAAGLVLMVVVRDPDPQPATSTASSPEASTLPSPSPTGGGTPTHPQPSRSAASDALTPGSPETVTVEPAVTKPPVALDEPASFGSGLVARVTGLEAVRGEATGPGETAGPALRVVVEIRNTSGRAVSLARSIVTVSYGRDPAPGVALSGPGVRPLAGSVGAGGSATGSYVFGVPEDERDKIQVSISVDAAQPTVIFEGSAS